MDESKNLITNNSKPDLANDTEQSVTGSEVTETDYTSGDKLPSVAKLPGSKKSESKSKSSSIKKTTKKQKKTTVQSGVIFEPCVFGKSKLWLPQVFTSDKNIFNDVVSMSTWEHELTTEEKGALTKLLPSFTEDNDGEQKETLRQLFGGEQFHFGNPLRQFGQDLQDGRYKVENVEKQRAWDLLQREECKLQNSHRLQTMLPEVIVKRQELLEVVAFTSPSEFIEKPQPRVKPSKIDVQGKQKYEKLLEDLSLELGETLTSDDDDDEFGNGMLSDYDDITQPPWEDRLHTMFDSPTEETHCTITPRPAEVTMNGDLDEKKAEEEETKSDKKKLPAADVVTEKDYMRMLERLQIVKEDAVDHPEFITSHLSLRGIINRTYPVRAQTVEEPAAVKRKLKKGKEDLKAKKKKRTPASSPKPSTPGSMVVGLQDSLTGAVGGVPPPLELTGDEAGDVTPKPEETPLEGAQETDLAVSSIKLEEPVYMGPSMGSQEVLNKVQYQVPHSFFALLRKHFTNAMNHRLWLKELQEKVSIWEKSPLSAFCPWRPLQLTWSKVVENTLYFLSLEEQGKLVNYVDEEDAWVWPDPMSVSNDELTKLFKRWLDLMLRVQPEERFALAVTPVPISEGTIPEPRMYTEYKVQASTEEDITQFRAQEHQRFSEPHKPFTYFQHGYEGVVGPVKGITPTDPLRVSKGREHSLLISDRPSYVTILSLVRDAMARLPNGEGTKIELCHLLRDSQFIAPDPESSLLAAVSGALDRLHNEKDPSVKFDAPRKLWVYLHRNRSVLDFERIQMEQILAGKTKRASTKPKQLRAPSVDLPVDFMSAHLDAVSPALELVGHGSLGASLSPRSLAMTTSTMDMGQPLDPLSSADPTMDPNLPTIQSLISESLIKSQLLKKPRSKTPPASLGRSTSTGKKAAVLQPGGIQRSLSIPASWPPKSAAGDLIPCNALITDSEMVITADGTLQGALVPMEKKPPLPPASRPKKISGAGKSSGGGKSKTAREKSSKGSKSSGSEKKSPTVQLKSGAITVTLPSSALKGQTVRSILASAASITIGNQPGEDQSHPTVQAVRKRLLAEQGQGTKSKHVKQSEQPKVDDPHQMVGQPIATVVPMKGDAQRAAGLPTIILRPNQGFITPSGTQPKEVLVSTAQMQPQSLTLVGAKPTGVITGLTAQASKQIPLSITGIAGPPTSKPIPLSLVVSGNTSRGSPAATRPVLQQGGIQMTSLTPGQNFIVQMPDGSKFMTSIPGEKPAPLKIPRQSHPVIISGQVGSLQQGSPQQSRRVSSGSGHNPYDFSKNQGTFTSASGQSGTSTSGPMKQGLLIPTHQAPAQTFALNLVTKPGENVNRSGQQVQQQVYQEPVMAQAMIKATAQVGTARGTPAQVGMVVGTSQQPTGILVTPISQSIGVSRVLGGTSSPGRLSMSQGNVAVAMDLQKRVHTAGHLVTERRVVSHGDMPRLSSDKALGEVSRTGSGQENVPTSHSAGHPNPASPIKMLPSDCHVMENKETPSPSNPRRATVIVDTSVVNMGGNSASKTPVISSESVAKSDTEATSSACPPGSTISQTSRTVSSSSSTISAASATPSVVTSQRPDTRTLPLETSVHSESLISKHSTPDLQTGSQTFQQAVISGTLVKAVSGKLVDSSSHSGMEERTLAVSSSGSITTGDANLLTSQTERSSHANSSSTASSSVPSSYHVVQDPGRMLPGAAAVPPSGSHTGSISSFTQSVIVSSPIVQTSPSFQSPQRLVAQRTVLVQGNNPRVSSAGAMPSSTPGVLYLSQTSPRVSQSVSLGATVSPKTAGSRMAVRRVPAHQTRVITPQRGIRIIRQLPPRHQMTTTSRQVQATRRTSALSPGREGSSQAGGQTQPLTTTVQSVIRVAGPQDIVRDSAAQSTASAHPSASLSVARTPTSTPTVVRPSGTQARRSPSVQPSRGLARKSLAQTRPRGGGGASSSVRVVQRHHSAPGILRKPQDPYRKTVVTNPPRKLTRPREPIRTVTDAPKRRASSYTSPAPVALRNVEMVPQDLSMKPVREEDSPAGVAPSGMQLGVGNSSTKAVSGTMEKDRGKESGAGERNPATGSRVKDVFMSGASSRSASSSVDSKVGASTMKTAKLIKSQELADAVSGVSEQGGQEQT